MTIYTNRGKSTLIYHFFIIIESQHSRNDLVLCTDTASVTTAIETLTKADYPDLFVHGDLAIHQSTPTALLLLY